MDISAISLLVIAGGQSSRMGQDKRWLELDGTAMLERLLRKAQRQSFRQRFLCVERETPELLALAGQYDFMLLADEQAGVGPMEGLRCGLAAMRTAYGMAVSCDMPFFSFSAMQPLLDILTDTADWQAVLAEAGGRRQPLAALYHRDMAVRFADSLAAGERKLGKVIAGASHQLVPVPRVNCFFNANTPADMRLARGRLANSRREIPLVTVAAPVSNTGKTTFIERLIPRLGVQGIRVGVVKGDCHGYDVDVEGKDSWRFTQAGADAVAVVSPDGYFIQRRTAKRASLLSVAAKMESVDLVLIESRSHGTVPKLSLWRGLGEPLIDADTVALFAGEIPQAVKDEQVYCYGIDDIARAEQLVRFLMGKDF
ncbi:molybdopterin-guanine dinucleotide biosynthesis protein [Selenomonas sp. GACV-9]|uniref:molybdopterin-guanine dinucleotide biosynthesis protein B n=1 Tax=Selenomonas sp. GACV-9 TaxID=3158782 RepID=UPI0008DF9B33|nr:molybdopterin-guanine dinucleotide biosynthesis protein [Selenomonas ruminantium]